MLSERRSARASCHAAATLTAAPSRPTTSTTPPSTAGGELKRWTASIAITPASTSSAAPLTCAESTSARPRPNVKRPLGGRAASRAATSASVSEAASVSMCAASESSASESGEQARGDLRDHEREDQRERRCEPLAVGVGRHRVVVVLMGVVRVGV